MQWISAEQQWTAVEQQWQPSKFGEEVAVPPLLVGSLPLSPKYSPHQFFPEVGFLGVRSILPQYTMGKIVTAGKSASIASTPHLDLSFFVETGLSALTGAAILPAGNVTSSAGRIATLTCPAQLDMVWHALSGQTAHEGKVVSPAAAMYPLGSDSAVVKFAPGIGWAQRIASGLVADEGIPPGGGRGFRLVPASSGVNPLRPWHFWTVDPYRVQEVYLVTLTGDANGLEDLTVPASSLQARRRDGTPSYLQIVTHGADMEQSVKDRPNGQLVVRKGYRFQDGSIQSEEIVRVDLEVVRVDQGGRSHSVTLRGHRTVTTADPNEVDLSGARERRVIAGQRRYTVDVEPFLRPGDLVTVRGETYRVGYLEYVIAPRESKMEVVESEA